MAVLERWKDSVILWLQRKKGRWRVVRWIFGADFLSEEVVVQRRRCDDWPAADVGFVLAFVFICAEGCFDHFDIFDAADGYEDSLPGQQEHFRQRDGKVLFPPLSRDELGEVVQ